MKVHDYFATVAPLSEEDGGGFVAHVPDLPGCIGDGDTPEAALSDVYQAAEAWLEANAEMGREAPEPGVAIQKAREQRETLIGALRTALSLLDESEVVISDLVRQVQHLSLLMSDDDRRYVSLTAIASSTGSAGRICH